MQAVNPTNGAPLGDFPEITQSELEVALERASQGMEKWRALSFAARADRFGKLACLLRARQSDLAERMALEMGKPVVQGRAEVEKCAWVCEHYAKEAESLLAEKAIDTDGSWSGVVFRPLGTVFAVMPWNFPFWQVLRCAAPIMMAGNGMVLKHAENVPGCAADIQTLFDDAGFEDGAFVNLAVDKSRANSIIAHPAISAVTLTGSTQAGRAVAAQAGAALKKTVLELGGSDAYVVLDDADLELAARIIVQSRLINSGQSCVAAKRVVVTPKNLETLTQKIVAGMEAAIQGDPLDEETEVGPLARLDLREALHGQVEKSLAQGARCLLGGKTPSGPGAFYPPTVLTDVVPGMPAFDEELFGPALAIVAAQDEDHALNLANQSEYGLGACVVTADVSRGRALAEDRLEAGACFVNAFVKSDPRLPFGGIRASGYGRELGPAGIYEFVNKKTVYVA
jgi:succinate-semialdehyde dehydrogenase/glutarate-semialdehyde dehydrogenase